MSNLKNMVIYGIMIDSTLKFMQSFSALYSRYRSMFEREVKSVISYSLTYIVYVISK